MDISSVTSAPGLQAARVQGEIAMAVLRQLVQQQQQQGEALVEMMRESLPSVPPGHVDTYA
jgi:hypothetical protein